MISEKNDGLVRIGLLAHTNIDPSLLISHAAFTCYQAERPEEGKEIDIENRLFSVGHHTTLQHWYATFSIEGIAVGDVTFGIHLASPFYNSDQRSGRFCSAMFSNPDFDAHERYIRKYWPEVENDRVDEVLGYLRLAFGFYKENLAKATELAKKYLKEERPNISEKALEGSCGKVAQEQMRMFIPIIFPTALDFTVDLSSLVAMWLSAWSPSLRAITDMMRDLILEKYPKISFMFNPEKRRKTDWSPQRKPVSSVCQKPTYRLEETFVVGQNLTKPDSADMHPVDLLHFKPEMMGNSGSFISALINISCATMGQDQRHRTIKRTDPIFSGFVYLPPLLAELSVEKDLLRIAKMWEYLSSTLPGSLGSLLAPYGAMVLYRKSGDLNAISHEMAKRTCWCTQEEIYHLAVQMRRQVLNERPDLESLFAPPCISGGKCGEGSRYCGRDLSCLDFSERKV